MTSYKIPKIQHYVPQFILKNFTEKKGQIWVFDKQTNRKFKTNVRNVAAENGFYNFDLEDREATFEPSLAEIEGRTSGIFKKIIHSKKLSVINNEEKLLLSSFLALQFVRTKQYRDMWKNMAEAFEESITERGWNPKNIEGYKESSAEDAKLFQMRSIFKAGEFRPYFYNKSWVLLKATKKRPFWISDNPISMQNMNDFGFYGNIGLAVKGIEIYFPLTKELSLGLWCPSHEEEFTKRYENYKYLSRINPERVARAVEDPLYLEQMMSGLKEGRTIPSKPESIINHNALQVEYAARYVYSNSEDFSLAEEMIKTNPGYREGPKVKVG